MQRAVCLLLALAFTASVDAQPEKPKWPPSPHVAATEPLRPEAQLKKMKAPPGFEIQLVAADPDIRKPINIAFDAAGRLWVTETIEYPHPAKPGKERDAVKILEDFGPDGRARKITTFVDKLNIPIGVIPDIDGKGALVYDIPAIRHMRDTDGDGKADKRDVYYGSFGHDDTHGMTGEFLRGFDGWIYACHGFRNKSDVKCKDGSTSISMESGNTYRIKADGSRIEKYTTGQVNPFGIAIDPLGNLFTADCHSKPLTMLMRGAWYESFARPHDGLGFAPHLNTFKGHSTALCGIAYYAADQFPKHYEGKLFLGDVVLNRVNAYKLEWAARPFTSPPTWNPKEAIAVMEDFITSQDPWFRPVDIKLGPDGCLYIADFYNRIIGHYEVPLDHPGRDRDKGRIWRVVWRGGALAKKKEEPRPVLDLTKADVKTLVETLKNPNLMVRLQAADQLVERGGNDAVEQVQAVLLPINVGGDNKHKAHALWILERLGKLDDKTLGVAVRAPTLEVRVHALRILAQKTKWSPEYTAMVKGELRFPNESLILRLAVEALAAHPHPDHIPLLASVGSNLYNSTDPHMNYAYRYALREQLRDKVMWEKVDTKKWNITVQQYVANIATALRHEPSGNFLRSHLERTNGRSAEHLGHAVRYGSDETTLWAIQHAIKVVPFESESDQLGALLKAIVQANQERGRKLTAAELEALEPAVVRVLRRPSGKPLSTPSKSERDSWLFGIELAGILKIRQAESQLLSHVRTSNNEPALRRASVAALVAIDPKRATEQLVPILVASHQLINIREEIATALASLNSADANAVLIKALEGAPARLQSTIALGMAASPNGAKHLLEAIEAGKASPHLLQDRTIEVRLTNAKIPNVNNRLKKLLQDLPPVNAKMEELIKTKSSAFYTFKPNPNADMGQKIFQKSCAVCHQINNQGAKVGPQLDGIGVRGLERLLEDILDPNRNVDGAFRTTQIVTKNGQSVSGLFLREEGNVVIVGDKDGKEVRIEKGMIDERNVLPLSPMPSNFAETIGEAEFNHLMAFLLSQRGKQ